MRVMTQKLSDIALSMLDLVAVREGGTVAEALAIALRTAQHAEALGFKRYWLAEHHNMAGIASSATAVLVGHIAGGTQRIRVGSGGVMLPNHAPLVVAEQFGTLATIYPGRIELGLGRAPGTDQPTMRALRRTLAHADEDSFPLSTFPMFSHERPRRMTVMHAVGVDAAGERTPLSPRVSAATSEPLQSLRTLELAVQAGLPVVPVSVIGTRHVMTKGELTTRPGDAVRFRKNLVRDRLSEVLDRAASEGGPLRFLSVAAGPAQEVYELLKQRKTIPVPVEIVLFDQDKGALSYAYRRISPIVSARWSKLVTVTYLHDSIKRLLRDALPP